jgi:hypothetical protein
MRDAFSQAVIRDVRDRVGNLCSQPNCRKPTVGADQSSNDKVKVIGVAAHIRAASPGGARYDKTQTPLERASIDNAIWLCSNCASLIDKNSGRDFPEDKLHQWKQEAEASSARALLFSGSLSRPDWLDRIHYAQFINVPRLGAMLSAGDLFQQTGLDAARGFRGEGSRIATISASLENALRRASIEALPLDEVMPPSEELAGQLISFEHRCYTKNGVDAGEVVNPKLLSTFSPTRSPHFYIKLDKTKVIFPYDPAWVTTSTAYGDFRGGTRRFAGLGLVKFVSEDQTEVRVSPLVVAFPRNAFMQAFYGKK